MMQASEMFRFHEVHRAPARAGVYAWYCRFHLTTRDIQDCIDSLPSEDGARRKELASFLARFLFDTFTEADYDVSLTGQLKPTYRGRISQTSSISPGLLERLSANPSLLHELAGVLANAVPNFAAPIYIGSALNLRQRLRQHVNLMTKYLDASSTVEEATSDAAHSFAHEVARVRKLDPNDLWFTCMICDIDPGFRFVVENVLNRINYPLCGRN